MKNTLSLQKSGWKKEYLRILLSGPKDADDYFLARELIDDGYADGRYVVSKRKDDYGQVTQLARWSINSRGRLFADTLENEIEKATWRYRITQALYGLACAGAGFALDIAKNWVSC